MRASWLRIREDLHPQTKLILGSVALVGAFLAWLALTWGEPVETRFIGPQILSNPIEVLQSFKALYLERALSLSVLYSFLRATAGFALAAMIAIPLGILMGSFPRIRSFFDPLVAIGGYVPIVVFVPLTLTWYALGEKQKILFLALACLVMLLPLVVSALDEVEDAYLQCAYTLGADRWQTIRHVLVPVALAKIYDHMCLTYGVAWGYIILAEMIDAKYGLGYLIITSQRRGPNEHIYAVILVIIAISFGINWLMRQFGEALFPYRETN